MRGTLHSHNKFPEQFLPQLRALWNDNYPISLFLPTIKDLSDYLDRLINPTHYTIEEDGKLLAWHAIFDRNDERWFIMIIHQSYQRKGLGRSLLENSKKVENQLAGWVIESDEYIKHDNSRYISPLNFYLKNNFDVDKTFRLQKNGIETVKVFWRKPFGPIV